MEQLYPYWYTWGALVAFLITILATFWVWYDASRKDADAIAWKTITSLALVLILPSIVLSIVPNIAQGNGLLQSAFLVIGIVAVVLALAALIFYLAGVGINTGMRCPNCNQPRDPTWPYCPYCKYDMPQPVAPVQLPTYQQPPAQIYQAPAPIAPFLVPPPTPIAPMGGAPNIATGETMSLNQKASEPIGGETQVLGPSGEPATSAPQSPATRIIIAKPKLSYFGYLVLRSGNHEGKTFPLSDVTNIGRNAESNDIVLDDDSVSREHARIRFEDGKFVLYDLASANHTFIQDADTGEWKRIQQRALVDGMMIKLGESILSYMQVKANKEG